MQQQSEDQIARLKCVIIEAEQAPPVEAVIEDEHEETTDLDLTPFLVAEEHGV